MQLYIMKFVIPDYSITVDKQTTEQLNADINTANTITPEVKEAELTTVPYKNEIKINENEDKDKRENDKVSVASV